MIDRASWGPELITTAQSMGAKAIGGYAFDHFLADVDGFCGGWTPAAIASIYNAGLDFHPIFVFRDGEAPPTPERCVEILKALGVHEGAWCHGDYENGAISTPAAAAALTSAFKVAGYRSAPYGTSGTLNLGYLSGADGAWVASYLGLPWDSANVQLVNVPNVGAWDFIGWQYANSNSVNGVVVDVSICNFPIGGVLAATATASSGGTIPMTRNDWAALFTVLAPVYWGRQINHAPDATPSGPEDQFWAIHVEQAGPVQAIADFMAVVNPPHFEHAGTAVPAHTHTGSVTVQ